MTVDGRIENGQIVLNQEITLPEGMKVRVEFVSTEPVPESTNEATSEELPSLYERMKSVAGKAKGLPTDLAINHDYYLHGQPKRQ